MKLIAVFALIFAIAVSSTHAEEDVVGDKVPASVVLAAVQSAAEDGADFVAFDGVVAIVNESEDLLEENPLLRGIIKKCKSGECRKKCNAKGQNGACIWIKCVCWK